MEERKNKIKKTIIKVFFGGVFFVGCSFWGQSFAETDYQPFTDLPGQEESVSDFPHYLTLIYKFGITSATILAVFMISLGAFNYIVTSAGNASKMANAKDMIYNAVYGLVLIMIAWIIMYLINPDLVGGEIGLDSMKKIDEIVGE